MDPIPLTKEAVELITISIYTFSGLYLVGSLLRLLCRPQVQDNAEVLEAIEDLKISLLEAIHNCEKDEGEQDEGEQDEGEQDEEEQDEEEQDEEEQDEEAVKATVVEQSPVKATVVEQSPVKATLVEKAAVKATVVQKSPVKATVVQKKAPVNAAIVEQAPVKELSIQDRHAILRSKLTPNQKVYVSYKKITFGATYELNAEAPNGYVFKYNNIEYINPTQFSFMIKRSLNPNLVSDNGWDTVYILDADEKKHSLKSLT